MKRSMRLNADLFEALLSDYKRLICQLFNYAQDERLKDLPILEVYRTHAGYCHAFQEGLYIMEPREFLSFVLEQIQAAEKAVADYAELLVQRKEEEVEYF